MTTIAKCPGCGKPCLTNDDSLPSIKRPASKHWVFCEDTDYCQYSSPARPTELEAIDCHNALCRQGVPVSQEVIDFLLGIGPLEGRWFGDTGPIENGYRKNYWWRKYLNGTLGQQRKCAEGNHTTDALLERHKQQEGL